METSHEDLGDGEVRLDVTISTEDIGDRFRRALTDFQRTARLPGFRPGKAPLAMLMRRFGDSLFEEVAEDIAKETALRAMDAENLKGVGTLRLALHDFGDGKPLRYSIQFLRKPNPKLTIYKGLPVVVNHAEISSRDVESQIEAMRRKRAMMRSIDTPATADAILTLKVREVDPSGMQIIGRPPEERQVEFGLDELGVGSDEQLMGIKAGDTRVIEVLRHDRVVSDVSLPARIMSLADAANLNDEYEGEIHLSVEALRVEIPELPPLDENFAREINGQLGSVEALREHVRQYLVDFVATQSMRDAEEMVKRRLLEQNPFPIPRKIIESGLQKSADEQGIRGSKRQKWIDDNFDEAEEDFRLQLLVEEICEREGISVSESDVRNEIETIALVTGRQLSDVEREYRSAEKREQLEDFIPEKRVLRLLTENAKIDRRLMDFWQFIQNLPQV